jgi:lysophospholipase L1-like esterase
MPPPSASRPCPDNPRSPGRFPAREAVWLLHTTPVPRQVRWEPGHPVRIRRSHWTGVTTLAANGLAENGGVGKCGGLEPVSLNLTSYVAIGDSFTEGVGDDLPDGRVRGWADRVAHGLAAASTKPVSYANLAIRGRLLAPIVSDQLDAAIALAPALISLNGGGNDILRPRVSIVSIADQLEAAVDRAVGSGAHVILLSGADPTRHIPLGSLVRARGNQLAASVRDRLPKEHVTFVDNWADAELGQLPYWSRDKLHLNPAGHARVAGNVLAALGVPIGDVSESGLSAEAHERTAAYWRRYVLPWIGRRLTGRSSGDNRKPKIATLQPVERLRHD